MAAYWYCYTLHYITCVFFEVHRSTCRLACIVHCRSDLTHTGGRGCSSACHLTAPASTVHRMDIALNARSAVHGSEHAQIAHTARSPRDVSQLSRCLLTRLPGPSRAAPRAGSSTTFRHALIASRVEHMLYLRWVWLYYHGHCSLRVCSRVCVSALMLLAGLVRAWVS